MSATSPPPAPWRRRSPSSIDCFRPTTWSRWSGSFHSWRPDGDLSSMGMEITKTFVVQAPAAAVWDFLTDPYKVASCLPGAAITEKVDDSNYTGTMTIKVGPVTASYRGKMRFDRL